MKTIIRFLLYVDLGLPSGTLWSRRNARRKMTRPEAGERFCAFLPSIEQWQELFARCSVKWNPLRRGYRLTGPNGRRLFLPARGYWNAHRKNTFFPGKMGYYWSKTKLPSGSTFGVYFFDNYINASFLSRQDDRFSIRTVR